MNSAISNCTAMVTAPQAAWVDRTLYPFPTRRFATPDGDMSYVDVGQGDPTLFVHGTPSWSFEWRAVIAAMSPMQRCIAPDHLGFGLSDKPATAPLAPEDHARRLRALVEALDLRDITLVVHDFGGPIGLPIALDLGARVRRVIVLNSFMWSNAEEPTMRRLDRLVRSVLGRFLYRWLNASPRMLLPASFGDRTRLSKRIHQQYIAPFARRREREAPYALARALVGSSSYYASLWERRGELANKELCFVWGERDPAFTERHLARWTAAFPEATVVRVPDAGHFVAEERPDVVVEVLRAAGSEARS
jgi:pimeloyl-ACP methyl ester carboxylesterase